MSDSLLNKANKFNWIINCINVSYLVVSVKSEGHEGCVLSSEPSLSDVFISACLYNGVMTVPGRLVYSWAWVMGGDTMINTLHCVNMQSPYYFFLRSTAKPPVWQMALCLPPSHHSTLCFQFFPCVCIYFSCFSKSHTAVPHCFSLASVSSFLSFHQRPITVWIKMRSTRLRRYEHAPSRASANYTQNLISNK